MYKTATYKEKLQDVKEWIPYMIDSIKKDLRNDHLKGDMPFVKKYLASKNIHKVTTEELAEAYEKAIRTEENGENLAEFISSRWLLKNSELYHFFEKELSQINPDFSNLDEIAPQQAEKLIESSNREYGPLQTYLFSVLNSVVFPKEIFEKLKGEAKHHQEKQLHDAVQLKDQESFENMRKEFEREMARLEDKYEKKLTGLQKKYLIDVEGLKKQIASLQKKLNQEKGH